MANHANRFAHHSCTNPTPRSGSKCTNRDSRVRTAGRPCWTVDAAGSRQIHGHTYEAEITMTGLPDAVSGMVIDLAYLRQEIERVRALLDHQFLDDIAELGPATLENLCLFIKKHLIGTVPHLSCVTIERRASGDKCTLRLQT
jgi:6-pyruvoyltetrahydropterin/6-carboxytetrahydropterin synthase